jgi:hypothetical protein
LILTPNWSDDLNNSPDSAEYSIPSVIKCSGGLIEAKNNVIDSLNYWLSGQVLDEDGQGGFIMCDSVPTYTMDDLELGWSDFADPQGNDFSYLSTEQLATAATDGGPVGDPRWLKSFTTPRTFTAVTNIEEATVTPARAYYEDGASVTVTASDVDGFRFISWKNVADETTLSTENPYTFNITSDLDVRAEYEELEVRNVEISVSNSSSASYTIDPEKSTYYEGDAITITVDTHYLNDFLGWSDGNMDLTRSIVIGDEDVILTADFSEYPYLVAWDLHQVTGNNTFTDLAANYYIDDANQGVMNAVSQGVQVSLSTRNNKFEGKEVFNCIMRKTLAENISDPDYFYIKFSTIGYQNLKVKSTIAAENATFKVQKMQYSLDGINYTDFATDTVSGDWYQIWRTFDAFLPAEAENKDNVYVRWIADNTSEQLLYDGVTDFLEYFVVSKIFVFIDQESTSSKEIATSETYEVYSVDDRLFVNAKKSALAEVYSILGSKITQVSVNPGINEISGLNSGVYIVRIGSQVNKVLVK